ncbi:MAG TPA: hypothetical protein VFS20_02120 [Longimicrobium sp.]|nr:hypothetical protein [Longimicrobium sp.]
MVAQTPFVAKTSDSPDLDLYGTTPEERDRLAAQAETYLRDQKNLDRLSARNVFLNSTEGGLALKLIRSDGSVAQAQFEPLDWPERFRDNPEGLARAINRVLHSASGPGIRSTVADKRYVFLRLMEDLAVRCSSDDEYILLGIASILRLLLWDEHPIADQINRALKVRVRLEFAVGETLTLPTTSSADTGGLRVVSSGLQLQATGEGFFPSTQTDVQRTVRKKDFLKLGVMIVEEHLFTVHDLLKHFAFVAGLLHAGEPKDAKDTAYFVYRSIFPLGGNLPGLATLRAIGRVVYTGLLPLQEAVLREAIDSDEAPNGS